jgi:hypothetical protein
MAKRGRPFQPGDKFPGGGPLSGERGQQQGRTTEAGLAIKELLRVLDSQAALRREQRGMFDSLENRVLQNRRAAFRNCGGVRNDGKEVNDGEARAALSTRQ